MSPLDAGVLAVGQLSDLGLGYDDLAQVNPALVYASITPFGLTGPKADWAATDLTGWAAAGPIVVTGDSDQAPLRLQPEQAGMHASAEAAGAIIADSAKLLSSNNGPVGMSELNSSGWVEM